MNDWNMQLAQARARITLALGRGEPPDSARLRQWMAEIERLEQQRILYRIDQPAVVSTREELSQ